MTKYLVGSSFLQGKHFFFFFGGIQSLSKESDSIEQMNFSRLERSEWDVLHVLKNQVSHRRFKLGSKVLAGFENHKLSALWVCGCLCVKTYIYKSRDSNDRQITTTPLALRKQQRMRKSCTYLLPEARPLCTHCSGWTEIIYAVCCVLGLHMCRRSNLNLEYTQDLPHSQGWPAVVH